MEERPWFRRFAGVSRAVIYALLGIAGVSLLAMVGIVTADVLFRMCGQGFKGSIDLLKILGALAIGCALPYTSAVKGHVAIEYFFQKLPRRGRIAVDAVARTLVVALCLFLAWRFGLYGEQLRTSGQVTPTLQLPIFWIPYVLALACVSTATVKVFHLLCPGKAMIKP